VAWQVSDLDGTMVGNGHEADAMTHNFKQYWEDNAALRNSVLVYNTGRSLGQFTSLYQEKAGALALPNVLITAVGTKVHLLSAPFCSPTHSSLLLRYAQLPSFFPITASLFLCWPLCEHISTSACSAKRACLYMFVIALYGVPLGARQRVVVMLLHSFGHNTGQLPCSFS